MSKILCSSEDLTSIADEVRKATGSIQALSLHDMPSFISSLGSDTWCFVLEDGSVVNIKDVGAITTQKGNVKRIISNATILWKSYVNQVPISTDTDGSIFNSTGYKDNVRLSSSGDISSSAQSGSVTTGFIPWYGDTTYLRMKGVEWLDAADKYNKHFYVNYYDSNKKFLVYHSSGEYSSGNHNHVVNVTRDSNGVETIKWSETYGTSNTMLQYVRKAAFIRITAYGNGADMIVTINEEIT